MRITQKGGVFIIDVIVNAPAVLFAVIGSRSDGAECRYRWQIRLHHINTRLIGIFKVEEEEGFFLLNRATNPESSLTASEEWIIGQAITIQARICRHVMVTEVEIARTVKIVTAGAGHDVDRAKSGDASGKIEIGTGKLKFLYDFLREILSGTTFNRVADIAAIHGNCGVRCRTAKNRHAELGIELSWISCCNQYTRFQLCQIQKVAPIQGKIFDLSSAYNALNRI